ncbi:MAG TPA: AI-2E family transporter, partial [Gammaproteobacteria bacterium]|nr:AI-2E family transporter [Gammaproteobacteria bacterium]
MIEILKKWYERHFSNPQVVILALLLITGFSIVISLGDILMPLLVAIVVAYMLEVPVMKMEARGFGRKIASLFVFTAFLAVLVISLVALFPLLFEQVSQFVTELPKMISRVQQELLRLPKEYPTHITPAHINEIMTLVKNEIGRLSQVVLSFSISSVQGLITWVVYLILIVLLVFFFLKDKEIIKSWISGYMPRKRVLVQQVWREMDVQIGNYIRGKMLEIIIVGVATYIAFVVMGLNYAILLGLLVGLSVLVPFVGATVVTIPVAITAFFQFGWSSEFGYLMLVYGIIQAIDGNVIVPLLFSEVVNLHPVAIIVAIIFFGGFWGFWGVFFAIPLATLVMAVLNAWPEACEVED